MIIYFVRHGERGHGIEQDILTEKGKEQAEEIAQYFYKLNSTKKEITRILSSSKMRAIDTAKPTANLLNIKIEILSELDEQRLGELEGKSGQEWRESLKISGMSEEEFRPKNGENKEDFKKRIQNFWLNNTNLDKTIIFSHAGFIRNSLNIFGGFSTDEVNSLKINYGSIVRLEINGNKRKYMILDY